MKIFFDGSCGPTNPGGKACFGFVLFEGQNEVYRGRGLECQGPSATNNVAEYAGLKRALIYLQTTGYKGPLQIVGDSNLVISQVNGEWKCKKPHLQTYLKEVHTLLDEFESWDAWWIPREENYIADELSKVTPFD